MYKKIINRGVEVTLVIPYIYDRLLSCIYKRAMKYCGKHVYLRPSCSDLRGLYNLSIGDYSSIPRGATFYCTKAELKIGNKVIFGPKPTIITGDHRIDIIGSFIMDNHIKTPDNDAAVIIEDDVWVGANVTILKGVTIGQGSVIAAGAVVTKSCLPFSIIGGIPAKVLKRRFTHEQIIEHERKLK